jgi:hypothetical protein
MKQTLAAILVLAGSAYGQGRVGPVGHGFGNVVFPGTGIPQQQRHQPAGHVQSLGATVRGVWPNQPHQGGYPQPRHRQLVAVPIAVPVYVGGYGYGYNGYGSDYAAQAPQPNITVVNALQPSPSVIINQNYTPDQARPVMHEYPAPAASELGSYQAPVPSHPEPVRPAPSAKASVASDDDNPTIYLIALEDGTVYPSYAYWLQGDTLHYITTKHSHNQASMALVDERLSLQLNKERRVEFKLRNHPAK